MIAIVQNGPIVRRSPNSNELLSSTRNGRAAPGSTCTGPWCQVIKDDDRWVSGRAPTTLNIAVRTGTAEGRLQPVTETLVALNGGQFILLPTLTKARASTVTVRQTTRVVTSR